MMNTRDTMLLNYLKIALRNLNRHRGYAFINITGLAVGMACCLLIVLFVRDELSYDTYHENADRIHRVVRSRSAYTAGPFGPALAADMAGVRQATRIRMFEETLVYPLADNVDKRFVESVAAVDSNFFDMFTHTFVHGTATTALMRPDALVLTESAAKKYFGETDPIGQSVVIEDSETFPLTVTAVIEDFPHNSHFRTDFIASFGLVEQTSTRLENWSTNWLFTYLLLEEGVSPAQLDAQLPAFFERRTGEPRSDIRIQPLLDIHLRSAGLELDIAPQGSMAYVATFSAIAFMVLLIACINFMNLATARSSMRSREVGLRKVLGARRDQLFGQFMGESIVLALVALLLAVAVAALALPAFGSVAGKQLALQADDAGFLAGAALTLTLIVGLLAGSYPAVFLSGFKPIDTLKGATAASSGRGGRGGRGGRKRGGALRKGLVVFQFGISTFLIIGTLVVVRQLDFIQDARLGFSKEQVVVLPIGSALDRGYETVKAEFSESPAVRQVSATGSVPGREVSDFLYRPEGHPGTTDDLPGWDTFFVDENYLTTMEIEIAAGRGFSRDIPTDRQAFILNETAVARAVERAGEAWNDPVGKQLDFYLPGADGWQVFKSGTVVGVVKDFHYRSMREEIGPLVLQVFPDAFGSLLVKISTEDVDQTLDFLAAKWKALGVQQPFDYAFLDQSFDRLYTADARLGTLFGYLAGLTVLIACMGLFGLAAFMTERRRKEIGVRKTLGATTSNITLLLSGEFTRLVLIAFVVAAPLAYLAMDRWLGGFAYRASIPAFVFLLAGFAVLAIAFATVSYQAVRAASADPVRALRYE